MGECVLDNFVILEGLDGAGTTTQLKMLETKLTSLELPHFCTCEPTEGAVGSLIRDVLNGKHNVNHKTIALLFAADRNEHVAGRQGGIFTRVTRGELVVSDRYLFSSFAYQGIECGFDYVQSLNSSFPLPSHVFFIDTPVELCQERIRGRQNPDLFDKVAFQTKVRAGYLLAFHKYKEASMKVHCIDGGRPAQQIFDSVWRVIKKLPIIGK